MKASILVVIPPKQLNTLVNILVTVSILALTPWDPLQWKQSYLWSCRIRAKVLWIKSLRKWLYLYLLLGWQDYKNNHICCHAIKELNAIGSSPCCRGFTCLGSLGSITMKATIFVATLPLELSVIGLNTSDSASGYTCLCSLVSMTIKIFVVTPSKDLSVISQNVSGNGNGFACLLGW